MLCPEVCNFPVPKIITSSKKTQDLEPILDAIKLNKFYQSVIVTCPDLLQVPSSIEELLTEDTDYYKISDCSLTEFLEPTFKSFIQNGSLYCLSVHRNCITGHCAAITPDGILTTHMPQYIYQTLGLEGKEQNHKSYKISIDLKDIKDIEKVRRGLSKLHSLDFYVYWRPNKDDICPSSIAKYFCDRDIKTEVQSIELEKITPNVHEIPSLKDTDLEEMTEWIGMLAIGGDLHPEEPFISTYLQPEGENSLQTTRISMVVAKGFLTPATVTSLCQSVHSLARSRDQENYWAAISVQSNANSPWQWGSSGSQMYVPHDNSCNVFFTRENVMMYCVGQLRYAY